MMNKTNTAKVIGKLQGGLCVDHEVEGEKFYTGTISVKRLSGMEDLLPITIPGRLLFEENDIAEEQNIMITGQIRTYNKIVDDKGRLIVTLYTNGISEAEAQDSTLNDIQLSGTLCRQPIFRTTPFGKEICDLMLAVNRGFGKSDYIPCIVWGANAQQAATFNAGDRVSLVGRFQSRDYEKKLDTGTIIRTAYEISASRITKEEEAA